MPMEAALWFIATSLVYWLAVFVAYRHGLEEGKKQARYIVIHDELHRHGG